MALRLAPKSGKVAPRRDRLRSIDGAAETGAAGGADGADAFRLPVSPDPSDNPRAPRSRRGRFSPLTRRILVVNITALAFLVAGLLFLGRYEGNLIQSELAALRTEAEIFAGALGEGALNQVSLVPSPLGNEGYRTRLTDRLAFSSSPISILNIH